MGRLLVRARVLAWCVVLCAGHAFAEVTDPHRVTGAMDFSLTHVDGGLPSWLYGGSGKLRFDEDHAGLRVSRAFVDYRGRIARTLYGHLTVNMNNDGEEPVDLTEAFLEWRPVPRSAWKFRGKFGVFYPRLSLENVEPGWTSAYNLSSSVINTWIGEELRTVGAELRVSRQLADLPEHQVSFEGAIYYGNDPTGAQLTWRGWAAHDRQTGLFGTVTMPRVSAIEAWVPGGNPTPDYEPFQEIDNRPGFYGGVEWRWGDRALVRAFHYDNHADPLATSGDTYAWQTWFDHVGAQVALPYGLGLLGQWIDGATRMGQDLGLWRVQDVDFNAYFVALTRSFNAHRLSLRYERFDLQPFADPAGITNQDDGTGFALAWQWQVSRRVRVGAEYLQLASEHCSADRCAWIASNLPRKTRESQLQLMLRWYFAG